MKETSQKIKGQWFTPDHIADEMVSMTPADWWSKGILEPTCGNGNLVIRILDEKVNHGLLPEEALNTTFANELDEKYANACTERVRQWAKDKGITSNWTCTNEDAASYDFSNIHYEYVWTNLPFGSNSFPMTKLPNRITQNVVRSKGIFITKPTTYKHHVKDYKVVDFPGIDFRCQISYYDLHCSESKTIMDRYTSLMADCCKWTVTDDTYTHVVRQMTRTSKFFSIATRDYYDKKGKLPGHCIKLKLTDEEYAKLNSYQNPLYEDYYRETYTYTILRNKKILYGFINAALHGEQ